MAGRGTPDTKRNGITCPKCSGWQTEVIDSRHTNGVIRRRRKCECGEKFWTTEMKNDVKLVSYRNAQRLELLGAKQRRMVLKFIDFLIGQNS